VVCVTDPHTDADGSIDRRGYLGALIAAGATGLAGCNSSGGDAPEGSNETTTEQEMGETGTTTFEPVTTSIANTSTTLPAQSQLNPWAANIKASGWEFFQEQSLPTLWGTSPNREDAKGQPYRLYSGHSWEIEGRGEVEVTTHIKNASVNPPFEWTHVFDDRITYWDGTPMDAEAHRLHDRVDFAGGHLKADETFNHEVVDQWTYRSWRDKGEAEGQNPNPTNAPILRSRIGTEAPFHPTYTREWAQRYEDATTEDAVKEITNDIQGVSVTFRDAQEKGLGSSVYRLESPEDITSQEIVGHRWDEHPNSENVTLDTLRVQVATGDRFNVLLQEGDIDFHEGIVQAETGQYNRNLLPDHVQELARFLRYNGNQVVMNWKNKHLSRLWVRRALVAAVDWEAVNVNGWGPSRTASLAYDTGMMNFHSNRYFQEGFLENLHRWPRGSDMELAEEYMRNAGYTKEDGIWTDWTGDAVDLSFLINNTVNEFIPAAQTIQQNLQQLGFQVGTTNVDWANFSSGMDNHNYDMALLWGTASRDIWDWYDTRGNSWAGRLVGGDPNDADLRVETEEMAEGTDATPDTHDDEGMPLQVQIPTDIGAIEAPDRAGASPDLAEAGIDSEMIDLAYLTNAFRFEDTTREDMVEFGRKCARFYNYYLPDFYFHQYTWGMWGNVRDYDFPERNHTAYQASDGTAGIDAYQALAGTISTKGDTDYPDP